MTKIKVIYCISNKVTEGKMRILLNRFRRRHKSNGKRKRYYFDEYKGSSKIGNRYSSYTKYERLNNSNQKLMDFGWV